MKVNKKEKGIALIALIATITIILASAGVAISTIVNKGKGPEPGGRKWTGTRIRWTEMDRDQK